MTFLPILDPAAKIWAIADTHLSFERPERDMSRFGSEWINHTDKIQHACETLIHPQDVLLIAGDLSWARKRAEVSTDLDFLNGLPGLKIVIRGNHDHWWKAKHPINHGQLIEPPVIFGNNEIGIAGCRGWQTPRLPSPDHDTKMLTREHALLTKQLGEISRCRHKIVMTHYPAQPFIDIVLQNAVNRVIFGHVHLRSLPEDEIFAIENALFQGVPHWCVAADRLNFSPVQIYPERHTT